MSIKSALLKAANRSLDAYAFVFARPLFRDWNAWLVHVGFRGLGVLNHRTDSLSGERHLLRSKLRMFLGKDDPVIFDVGANEGDFSVQLIEIFPRASVFAFEPHPSTFSRLSARLADKVRLKNAGLGSTVGLATLYDYGDRNGTGHASIYDHVLTAVHKTAKPVALEIEIDTIDNFCEAQGIELIDFLKIDTEGNELEVLKGANRLFQNQRLRYIQFEFNEMNVVSRVFLSDFVSLLPRHRLFRLLPQGLLPIENIPLTREVFAFQNLLAVPLDELQHCQLPGVSWFSRGQ